jgi:chorismate synthase
MKFTIFGESHGPAVGVALEGLPAGIAIDGAFIASELSRRATGKSPLSSARKESDKVEFISGVFGGITTGAPLCAVIENRDARSSDYEKIKDLARPGHADYAGFVKSGGFGDWRGGGHFSGRLTAAWVVAGSIAKQILAERGIEALAHIERVGQIGDDCIDAANPDAVALRAASQKDFPVLNDVFGERMKNIIELNRERQDSIGGAIECALLGIPAGVGAPDFDKNCEGVISKYMFSIPAVKAIGFGIGDEFGYINGSGANDAFRAEDGKIRTATNNNGGINGGITNGMPVVFHVTIKPTPSIARRQHTVNMRTGENADIEIAGRHDPCIVPRAVPVIESAAALAACELLGI